MESMQELSEYIAEQAKKYWEKANNVVIDEYPMSIVDFVLEYAISQCHFPKKFTEKQIVNDVQRCKNTLAMACNEIYGKAGMEGQTGSVELGISRTYETSWITPRLLSGLPNYVEIF